MIGRTTWSLLLVGTLLATAGGAAAQGLFDSDLDLFRSDDHGLGIEIDDRDFDANNDVGDCSRGELTGVADVSRSAVVEKTRDQTVSVDDDDVLLAIALANNGANDIEWNKIRDFRMTESHTRTASQRADLERDDVFSALALGVTANNGALDALACISDVEFTEKMTRTTERKIDLDEDDVLLAIALANSVGTDLEFDDIADIWESDRAEISQVRTVDVERNDAFLALALGAGG